MTIPNPHPILHLPSPLYRTAPVSFVLLLFLVVASPSEILGQATDPSPPAPPHSWSVEPLRAVVETAVRFENGGIELAGTLHSPEGMVDGPAVVVVQQGGTTTRDNPIFRQIAETFTGIGYSVLLYDRRGEGESGGEPGGRPDYLTLAEDAVAGKRRIAELAPVNPERIGYWGISQSGWIAMEAAVRSDPAFLMVVSSPLTTPGEQMEFLAHNYTLLAGHGEEAALEALSLRRKVAGEYFRGERSFESARQLLEEAVDEPWFESTFLPLPDELSRNVSESVWVGEMNYDPVAAFTEAGVPMLFVVGGEDFDFPVRRTLEIAAGLPDDDREIVVIPGASHVMRIEEDPRDQFELSPEDASNAEAYFLVMGEWLGRLGLGSP